jgi:hypothetical protein
MPLLCDGTEYTHSLHEYPNQQGGAGGLEEQETTAEIIEKLVKILVEEEGEDKAGELLLPIVQESVPVILGETDPGKVILELALDGSEVEY